MARKNKNARRQTRKATRTRWANQQLVNQEMEVEKRLKQRMAEMTRQAERAQDVTETVEAVEATANAVSAEAIPAETIFSKQISIEDVTEPPTARQVEQRIERIPLDKMILDVYQRSLNARNIAAIARNFNEARLGVLVVSERPNGFFAVLDGQHRLAAMRQLGIQSANCIVLEGMSLQEEAEFFRRQSENKQNLRVKDLFNAGIYAGDVQCMEIQKLLDKYSFRIGGSGQAKTVNALDALNSIVKLYGYEVLEYTLAVIDATWPTDRTVMRREMLAPLAEFGHCFRDKVTVSRFATRMMSKMPADLCRDMKNRNRGGSTPSMAFNKQVRFTSCSVLVDAYNKGLGSTSQNRLRFSWNDAMTEGEENV